MDDPSVKKDTDVLPYKIVAGENQDAWVDISGKKIFTKSNKCNDSSKNERNC